MQQQTRGRERVALEEVEEGTREREKAGNGVAVAGERVARLQ